MWKKKLNDWKDQWSDKVKIFLKFSFDKTLIIIWKEFENVHRLIISYHWKLSDIKNVTQVWQLLLFLLHIDNYYLTIIDKYDNYYFDFCIFGNYLELPYKSTIDFHLLLYLLTTKKKKKKNAALLDDKKWSYKRPYLGTAIRYRNCTVNC